MRRLFRAIVLSSLCSSSLMATAVALGAETRSGEQLVIKSDEVIGDSLYIFGQQITIEGTIEGDLIAFAQQITLNGTVKGDIIAAAQTIDINGAAEDARLAGQVLRLGPKGKIDGDLMAAGFSLECAKDSIVTGDVCY